MKKIINLNESDLKRIVKKVLSERRILNEGTLGKGEIESSALESLKTALSSGQGPWDKLREVIEACEANSDQMGPPKQSDSAIASAAQKIWDGINYGAWYTAGAGTDEDAIKKGISSLQSVPDLCAMIKKYNDTYEDFYESMDGDFDGDEEIATYVVAPMSNIISKQNTDSKNSGGGVPSTNGGGTPSTNGDGDVEDLQKILKDKGFDPGDVDGAFGPNTLRAALKAVRSL
jgi:hypothetical protein